jgi:hypothetical protein
MAQESLLLAETVKTANLIGNLGAASASITTSGTINTSNLVMKVTTGSAVTAVIMGSGVVDGQFCLVEHVGAAASSIAFATAGSAAASSHIATDFVFSGQKAALFVWESVTALWYPVSY